MYFKRLGAGLGAVSALGALLVCGANGAQAEDASVKATFQIKASGLILGRGTMEARIAPDNYEVGIAAKVSGLASLLAGGEGSATAHGFYTGDRLSPANYQIENTAGSFNNNIRMAMRANAVTSETITPPTMPAPDRVPLTDGSRKGVIDPLSAFLFPVASADDALKPSACNRTLKIYDGRQRYDIKLSYKRTEDVKDKGDFEAKAVVCGASWKPIAGHRKERIETKQMEQNRDMEAWLVLVPGTKMLMMYRMGMTTVAGPFSVEVQRVTINGQTTAAR